MAAGPQPLSVNAIMKKLAEFDSVPLFMKSLPSEEVDDGALAVLQSLAHEGNPDGQWDLIHIFRLYNLIIGTRGCSKFQRTRE